MNVTVLGCNGPYPAPGGGCSGYLVTAAGAAVQLDLGCATLPALTGRMPPEALTALCLSHWHGDHCSDVLPLLYRLGDAARRGAPPLPVYAPADPSSPVWREVQASPFLALHTLAPGDTAALGPFTLRAFAALHPVPALMYRLSCQGKTLAYTGDTNWTAPLPALARDADLLLADGLFPQAEWTAEKPHLSAQLCAQLARDAGAKALLITHLHPDKDPATLLREAQALFPGAQLARPGLTAAL